jgi:molybdopterin synthase catalytic subunit
MVRVQAEDFDVGQEVRQMQLAQSNIGAVVSFVGQVRDTNDGDTIAQLTLEHYPGMTEKALQAIADQAKARWDIVEVLIIHRIGTLNINDQIVFVAVSSAHRGEAFQACEFVMDYLKTEAPFWKKEVLQSGESRWVDARDTDEDAKQRWQDISTNYE